MSQFHLKPDLSLFGPLIQYFPWRTASPSRSSIDTPTVRTPGLLFLMRSSSRVCEPQNQGPSGGQPVVLGVRQELASENKEPLYWNGKGNTTRNEDETRRETDENLLSVRPGQIEEVRESGVTKRNVDEQQASSSRRRISRTDASYAPPSIERETRDGEHVYGVTENHPHISLSSIEQHKKPTCLSGPPLPTLKGGESLFSCSSYESDRTLLSPIHFYRRRHYRIHPLVDSPQRGMLY